MTDQRATAGANNSLNWPEASARPFEIERVRIALASPLDDRAALLRNPLSARAAAFRVLRHRIAKASDPRVLAVTSAGDEEGKTTCALNLALALAESGRHRVVLLEANTQSSALTTLLGFSTPACLLDQLIQYRVDPSRPWVAAQIASHNLDVLAAQPRMEARPPLHGPTLLAATTRLRTVYDYVVVDTSSILTGLDVPLVQDVAEGIVLAARTGHTRARQLKAAMNQIASDRIVGVVLIEP